MIQEAVNIRSYRVINRKKTKVVSVGNVLVGGDNPISVQTMTNTLTSDAKATLKQIEDCVKAGAELVRVSVPDVESTFALKEICKFSPVPIIADVHFHYKRGIEAAENGAKCIRINPGTVGSVERAREIVQAAKANGCSVRIGVNAGSLEDRLLQKYKSPCPEALVESAMDAVKMLEDLDFNQIKISVKASDVMLMIRSYEMMSAQCDYPLHLGVTEAGSFLTGTVKTSMGMGALLMQGIGDTIRVSLSAPPEEEPKVGFEILKGLGLRSRGITVIACPSCARQQFDVIKTVAEVEKRLAYITKPLTLSILGCVVNGIGEAQHTQIGVTGAGSGMHLIYRNGEPFTKAKTEDLIDEICKIAEEESKK